MHPLDNFQSEILKTPVSLADVRRLVDFDDIFKDHVFRNKVPSIEMERFNFSRKEIGLLIVQSLSRKHDTDPVLHELDLASLSASVSTDAQLLARAKSLNMSWDRVLHHASHQVRSAIIDVVADQLSQEKDQSLLDSIDLSRHGMGNDAHELWTKDGLRSEQVRKYLFNRLPMDGDTVDYLVSVGDKVRGQFFRARILDIQGAAIRAKITRTPYERLSLPGYDPKGDTVTFVPSVHSNIWTRKGFGEPLSLARLPLTPRVTVESFASYARPELLEEAA